MSFYHLKIRDFYGMMIVDHPVIYGSVPRVGEHILAQISAICRIGIEPPNDVATLDGPTSCVVVMVEHLLVTATWFDDSQRKQADTVVLCDLAVVVQKYGVRNVGVRLP